MILHRKREVWDYREATWVVYDCLCVLDEKDQFPLVKATIEAKRDAILFPMDEFDSVCQTLFGNHYKDFYKAIVKTSRASCLVMEEPWCKWDGEEGYFASESVPADFIKDESVFFEEAIKHDDWLDKLGFDKKEIEVFKRLHAEYLASESKPIGPPHSKPGCLSRTKD